MPQLIPFTKMQGIGNDFVVVDGRAHDGMNWSSLAVRVCDRKFGVGADGLLVVDNAPAQHGYADADVTMRMFNPDGTPDICGNGLRCVARYAFERGLVAANRFKIATFAGNYSVGVLRDMRELDGKMVSDGPVQAVLVMMGEPQFAPDAIPMHADGERVINYPLRLENGGVLPITALSTGSTHVVTFVDELPDDETFFAISPQVENHALFPERTSLMWCQVLPPHNNEGTGLRNHSRLKLRIWERGAGETLGCGTGACAAAVAAKITGHAAPDDPVFVSSKGGELHIMWNEGGPMSMLGPAEFVFDGEFLLPADEELEANARVE